MSNIIWLSSHIYFVAANIKHCMAITIYDIYHQMSNIVSNKVLCFINSLQTNL